jgi:DNA-directed RNA polymerase specialized sigma24 family protein
MWFFDGMTVGEITARLAVSEATVRLRLQNLRAMLLASMKRHGDR